MIVQELASRAKFLNELEDQNNKLTKVVIYGR